MPKPRHGLVFWGLRATSGFEAVALGFWGFGVLEFKASGFRI